MAKLFELLMPPTSFYTTPSPTESSKLQGLALIRTLSGLLTTSFIVTKLKVFGKRARTART